MEKNSHNLMNDFNIKRWALRVGKWTMTSFFCLSFFNIQAQDSIRFRSISDVWQFIEQRSTTFKNNRQQSLLSKYQTLAAKWNKWNIQGKANLSMTDNMTLNKSFIPAEIFGGPAGTYREITLGQKYISNITIAPQFDILNPYAAALVKLSKTNESLTEISNLLNRKDLYESIASAYCNILSYQWQIDVTQKSLKNADTIYQIMQNKFAEGIGRLQDANSAKANVLTIQDKLQQLQVQSAQQYNSLKLLCDMDTHTLLQIEPADDDPIAKNLSANSNLQARQSELKYNYELANLQADKKWFYPTVTLLGSAAWQQNTSTNFLDNTKWLAANYVGLRLTMPIIPDVNKVAAVKYDKINLAIAQNTFQHAALQDSINNAQLVLDYQKSYNSYILSKQTETLKEDSYYKNLNIYKEGILSATDLLNSFADWLNSSLNTVAQKANCDYYEAKIDISNLVK